MRGLRHPVGPEKPGIYWGRRLLVLLVFSLAIALIVTVAWLATAKQSSTGEQGSNDTATSAPVSEAATSAPTATDAPSSAPASEAPTEAATTATTTAPVTNDPAPATTAPAQPAEIGQCNPADIKVSLKGPSRTKINANTTLNVAWTNATQQPCIFNPSNPQFELKIYSGTDRIWSTLDCTTGVPYGSIKMESAVPLTFDLTWNGQRSAAGCKLTNNLRPGTYIATAEVAGGSSAKQVMVLHW